MNLVSEKLCSDTGSSHVQFVRSTSPPFLFGLLRLSLMFAEGKKMEKLRKFPSEKKMFYSYVFHRSDGKKIGCRFAYNNMHNMIFTPLHHLAFSIDQKKRKKHINTHRLLSTNLAMQQDKGIITRRHQNIIET